MVTEAKKKAIEKYNTTKLDHIHLRLPLGQKLLVQKVAKLNNESVNGMINRLIDQEIERVLKQ